MHMFARYRALGWAIIPAIVVLCSSSAKSAEEVKFLTYGGPLTEAEMKAFYLPAAKELGITVKTYVVPTPTRLANLRAQARDKSVSYDLVGLYGGVCEQVAKEGLTEELDYSIINKDGVPPGLFGKNWIATNTTSTVLAYNTKVYGDKGPQTWRDFWDTEKFPGRRAMQGRDASVEISLLADGVPPKELYPADLDRVEKKIKQIKPHVNVWWNAGSQQLQLMQNEEVDILSTWLQQADQAIEEGAPYKYTYNEALLVFQCVAIPKGAPNKDLAMKLIAAAITPDAQAELTKHINSGPVNTKAYDTGKISKERAQQLNTSPENLAKQIIVNADWWSTHFGEVLDRFNKVIQQ